MRIYQSNKFYFLANLASNVNLNAERYTENISWEQTINRKYWKSLQKSINLWRSPFIRNHYCLL